MTKGPSAQDIIQRRGVQVVDRSLDRSRERVARQQAGIGDTVVWIALDELEIDPRIQVRLNGLDPERVQQYATAMIAYQGWGSFPPLDVFRDPETNKLRIAGGFHRTAGVPIANLELVNGGVFPILEAPCNVHPGGIEDAIEFAEEDNLKHGLNLTSRDKRGIFMRRMAVVDHPWQAWSNRLIAAELGVDEGTIRNWIKALAPLTAENSAVREDEGKKQPQKRVVQRGDETYEMDTGKIGQRRARRGTSKPAEIIPEPEPIQPEPMSEELAWSMDMLVVPDDPAQIKPFVVALLRRAGEGLARLDDCEGEAQQVGDWADWFEKEWKL